MDASVGQLGQPDVISKFMIAVHAQITPPSSFDFVYWAAPHSCAVAHPIHSPNPILTLRG
jgi:hypothetical protein